MNDINTERFLPCRLMVAVGAIVLVSLGVALLTQLTARAETVCWRTGLNHPKYAEGYRWNFQFLGEDIADPDYPVMSGIQANICPIWEDPDPPTEEERIQRHYKFQTRVAERELRQQRGAESAAEDEAQTQPTPQPVSDPVPAPVPTPVPRTGGKVPTPVDTDGADDEPDPEPPPSNPGTEPSPDDAEDRSEGETDATEDETDTTEDDKPPRRQRANPWPPRWYCWWWWWYC